MKIKVIDNLHFQQIPVEDDFEEWEITLEELYQIGITKQFDISNHKIIDYVNPQFRIDEIKSRLNSLSQDFIQAELGAKFDDFDDRKAEFIGMHNELRELLGKEPRVYE